MEIRPEVTQLQADMCSAVSDPSRISIIYELAKGPLNVSKLAKAVDLSPSATSRHLKILRDSLFVSANRIGHKVEYSLITPELIDALDIILGILNQQLAHRANLLKLERYNEEQ
ncbi:MAG TPA: metalloregulator ArsR/SmtB family transcription factor [Anaerolineales bacterium]|nr:metalloregulator ArsR/SmtB family transcription factor [Anaerolineales bacterium]